MPEKPDTELHQRWAAKLPSTAHWYGESQVQDQCGGCAAYRPLAGPIGADWGACTSGASLCDGTIRFEHDGCEAFTPAGPDDFAPFV